MKSILILLLCLPSWIGATIYQWQDTDGNRHFSDQSRPEAKIIQIKPGYGFQKVKTVYDGDTVELADGRKVRLLGINTPEIQHRDQLAEAGGEEAKTWLTNKLKNTRIRLEIGNEKTDKYGRTLAHLFTEQKEHINLQLVESGLASVVIYPPNLDYVDELVAAENQAEKAGLGIWHHTDYAIIPVNDLPGAGRHGWTRLLGQVIAVRHTKKSVYLDFSDRFAARIEQNWLSLFPDVDSYLGKTMEIRGWLHNSKGKLSMLIRHPSALKMR